MKFKLAFLACIAISPVALADEPNKLPDWKPFQAKLKELVEKHYPKATWSKQDGVLHIEFNTRKFMIHESLLDGLTWQDAHEETGPQKGGIVGEIELRSGQYGGMAAVPQTFDKHYFKTLLTAPHSQKFDCHLYVHLKYPRNVPPEFLREFQKLCDGFESVLQKK